MADAALISNPSESHQTDIIVSAVVCWVIGAGFVGLRFYARGVLLHNAIGVEDWLIVVALVFSAATSAGAIERECRISRDCLGTDANPPDRGCIRLWKAYDGHRLHKFHANDEGMRTNDTPKPCIPTQPLTNTSLSPPRPAGSASSGT